MPISGGAASLAFLAYLRSLAMKRSPLRRKDRLTNEGCEGVRQFYRLGGQRQLAENAPAPDILMTEREVPSLDIGLRNASSNYDVKPFPLRSFSHLGPKNPENEKVI